MKKLYTDKIFYKKFIYKIRLYNEIGTLFRGKNLYRAKKYLDEMQSFAEINEHIPSPFNHGYRAPRFISLETFIDATLLYKAFQENTTDYMLRCECNYLDIYSNDKEWLNEIADKITCLEFYQPASETQAEFLLNNSNVILTDKHSKWKYKAYLSNFVDPLFANFCRQNKKNIKVGKVALEAIEKSHYINGFYFYTTSEKFLMLANIASGTKLTRIIKYVNREELNK